MNPLERKKALQLAFKKRNDERIKQGKPLLKVKDLNLDILPETFEWFRNWR